MEIFRVFHFDAAHRLPQVHAGHKCGNLHGHTFRLEVHVNGGVDEQTGWVMDFADIAAVSKPLLEQLDHRCLNEIEGLENPTSEQLVRWLWRSLKPQLPGLSRLVLQESPRCGVVYCGELD